MDVAKPISPWKQVSLGSLASFRNGLNYTKEARDRGGLPIVGVKDFQDRVTLETEGLEELDASQVDCGETTIEKGDILFVRSNGNRELIGRSMFVATKPARPTTYSGFSIRLRFHSNAVHPRFFAYLFRGPVIRNTLSSQGGGTNISNLNQGILANLQVPLAPLPSQRRIASILGAYDDLIEVNRRRIAVLEEMARRLFDEWFVHFRFPRHEGYKMVETEQGMLPEGWTVRVVEELVKRIPVGRKYDQKTVSALGAVPVFDQGKTGIIGYHNDAPGVSASEHDPVVVFANHTCYQRLVHFPFSAIQNVLPFVPNPAAARNIYWLHWATNGLVSLNDYKGHWPEFAAKKVVVPIAELCKRFGDFVAPLSLSILRLGRSDENLAKARELLLPRLISGELPVAAAEDALEEAA